MIPFKNCLRVGDVVEHALTKRRGKVTKQPHRMSLNVCVCWDGNTTEYYIAVMQLRFVVNGVAEANPPVEGEPPEWKLVPRRVQRPPAAPAAMPPAEPANPPPRPLTAPHSAIGNGMAASAKLPAKVAQADAAYEGDVTLERLCEIRKKLREQLDLLDERLLLLRCQVIVRRQLEPIRSMAEVEDRCDIAADAVKIKRNADDALALLKRLDQPHT